MQSRTITATNTENRRKSDLMSCVITNNLTQIKLLNLVNRANVNNIIDIPNKATALHYSLQLFDSTIANFLLNLGADPELKNATGQNSYDLSLQFHKRCVFDFIIADKNSEIDELKCDNNQLKKKLKVEQDNKEFLSKSIDNYRGKIESLEKNTHILKEINRTISSENNDLLEQTKTLKRKVERLNESIDGFLNTNRK